MGEERRDPGCCKVSIVVPCFNEQDCIRETHRRLCEVMAGRDVELLYVDDGSTDDTRQILGELAQQDHRVELYPLSRNFGHQIAVTAGVEQATGDVVVIIDADLQDPPELILSMIDMWGQGYDVVYGRRRSRAGETWFKLVTARYFYRVLNLLSDVHIPHDTGDFRLMSRRVVDVLKLMPESDRFVRGMVSWVGFRQTELLYQREERYAGASKYPLRKMISFAIDGILSFSIKPLRFAIWSGMLTSLMAMLGILYAVYARLFTDIWVSGWTFTIVAILFIGGVQLMCLGLIGEYVGRTYRQTKGRPIYILDREIDVATDRDMDGEKG